MFAMTLAVVALAQSAGTEMKLLRFPAVHGDSLAFVFGGDISAKTSSGNFVSWRELERFM